MSTPSIEIGATCTCKVGRNTIQVEVLSEDPKGGWQVKTPSGRSLVVRDVARLTAIAAPTKTARRKARKKDSDSAPKGGRIKGKMSGLDAAATILREQDNEPMNTTDLVDAAREAGYWAPEGKTPAATLYSAILREIQKKGDEARFTKVERGKFALRG